MAVATALQRDSSNGQIVHLNIIFALERDAPYQYRSAHSELSHLIMPKLTTAKRKKKASERNTACCGAAEAAEAVSTLAQRALQYGLRVESTLDRGRVSPAESSSCNTQNMHTAISNPL
jgi:hypothetical protein